MLTDVWPTAWVCTPNPSRAASRNGRMREALAAWARRLAVIMCVPFFDRFHARSTLQLAERQSERFAALKTARRKSVKMGM